MWKKQIPHRCRLYATHTHTHILSVFIDRFLWFLVFRTRRFRRKSITIYLVSTNSPTSSVRRFRTAHPWSCNNLNRFDFSKRIGKNKKLFKVKLYSLLGIKITSYGQMWMTRRQTIVIYQINNFFLTERNIQTRIRVSIEYDNRRFCSNRHLMLGFQTIWRFYFNSNYM